MAAAHGATFIVNDDVHAALALGADGVHLGRTDQGREHHLIDAVATHQQRVELRGIEQRAVKAGGDQRPGGPQRCGGRDGSDKGCEPR